MMYITNDKYRVQWLRPCVTTSSMPGYLLASVTAKIHQCGKSFSFTFMQICRDDFRTQEYHCENTKKPGHGTVGSSDCSIGRDRI